MQVIVKARGIEQVIDLIGDFTERLEDDTEAVRAASMVALRRAQTTIEAGGDPAWPGLADSTIKRRRNRNTGTIQILRDSGLLMQSLTPGSDVNEFSIREFENHLATVGTNRPGAEAHQTGSGNVPMRAFMIVTGQDAKDMAQIYMDHLLGFGED